MTEGGAPSVFEEVGDELCEEHETLIWYLSTEGCVDPSLDVGPVGS